MLEKDQLLWHSFRHLLQRVGSYFYTHFKHITASVWYVTDCLHRLNVGPVSQIAGLVSRGTTIADTIFDWAGDVYKSWYPPPKKVGAEPPSGGVPGTVT